MVWKSLERKCLVLVAGGRRDLRHPADRCDDGSRVVGLAAADGALLWSQPFQVQYDESISTPAVAGDMVLVTATGRPLTALRISRDGNKCKKQVAWTNEILSSYLSSMVASGDYVYGMNDGGEFSCLRLSDGKILWTGGNHGYYSSPIVAGQRLFALNERGQLAVLSADPAGYQELVQANSRPAKPGPCRLSSAAESMCAAPTDWRASRSVLNDGSLTLNKTRRNRARVRDTLSTHRFAFRA